MKFDGAGADLPARLAGQKFPPLFVVEAEYRLALTKAELAFVNELVRRLVEDGWGPIELWRNLQAATAKQHENGVPERQLSPQGEQHDPR